MPLSATINAEKFYPGAIVPMKFHSKYYEAEILKISGTTDWLMISYIYSCIPYCMLVASYSSSRHAYMACIYGMRALVN